MKKNIIIAAVCIFVVAAIAAILIHYYAADTVSKTNEGQDAASSGGDSQTNEGQGAAPGDELQEFAAEKKQITIFTFDKELEVIVGQYVKMHPEFNYNIVCRENDMDFFYDLNFSLQNGDGNKVDLYCVPASYAQWYIKGGYSGYASTYKELGIDVDTAVIKADIPQNIIEAGTRPGGDLIALPYKKNVNLFMYRRSIAKDVWGTDDPAEIANIIGAGTGKWDKFLRAAQTLKKNGCCILPDYEELFGLIETGISSDLISNRNYDVDPKWEEFMDFSKSLVDNGYVKGNQPWTATWLNDLGGKGDKPIFGFFTEDKHIRNLSSQLGNTAGDWAVCLPPISVDTGSNTGFDDMDYYTGIMVNKNSPNKVALGPLIEWITLDCSQTGLQYCLANDTFYTGIGGDELARYGGKRSVISGTVLKNTNNASQLLNGQNLNAVIYDAFQTPAGKHHAPGISLFTYWFYETQAYLRGEKDKKTAIADFKEEAKDNEQSFRARLEQDGMYYSAEGKLRSLIGNRELNVYSYDEKLPELIKIYAERHPEFNFKVNWYHYAMVDDYCTLSAINKNMQSVGGEVVDIYCVPGVYSPEMIKGDYSKHACSYKELGIDVDVALKKADIPQYVVDAGTNPNGEIISLPYMPGVNVFMYRRSIAKDVFGTDDPDKIAEIIGAGTEKWDMFLEAAQTLKEHGCYIVPGYRDLSEMIDTGISAPGSESGNSNDINPKWEEFMDISKQMLKNGYMHDTMAWSEQWSADLNGKGEKPVFGLVMPYEYLKGLSESDSNLKSTAGDWAICAPPFKTTAGFYTGIMVNKDSPNKDALGPLIEWLTLDCSDEGLQYGLANDTIFVKNSRLHDFYSGKNAVVSGTVLKDTNCSLDFLGGQNINPVIYDVLSASTGKHDNYGLDMSIFETWNYEAGAYLKGEKSRKTAVADFKKAEKEMRSWFKNTFDEYGISFLLP